MFLCRPFLCELSLLECERREASAESCLGWAGLGSLLVSLAALQPYSSESEGPVSLQVPPLAPLASPGLLRTILGYLRYRDC